MFIMLYKVVLNFVSVIELLKHVNWKTFYWTVVSCGAVYYAVTFTWVDEIKNYNRFSES